MSEARQLRAVDDSVLDTEGVLDMRALPDVALRAEWDSIHIPEAQKKRLLSMAVLAATVRPHVQRARVPLHGFIVLVGRPGTGKTTLARGLASRVAESLPQAGAWRFLEVEPHALVSAGLGGSQKKVRRLLQETVAEHAAGGPLVVLLDEVETLAADRYKLSLEANPVDVHRATDAVLASLDDLARRFPSLLVLATSNFVDAIDAALLSRADLVETILPPDRTGVELVLRDTLAELARTWPALAGISTSREFKRAIDGAVGLDGRQLRKSVLAACAADPTTALDPGKLTTSSLITAIENSQSAQRLKGTA
jgi:AAA+ superfamily predicted ATPase